MPDLTSQRERMVERQIAGRGVLRDGVSYRELGGDYFDHLNAQRLTRYHTQRLAALGYAVTLTKSAA